MKSILLSNILPLDFLKFVHNIKCYLRKTYGPTAVCRINCFKKYFAVHKKREIISMEGEQEDCFSACQLVKQKVN